VLPNIPANFGPVRARVTCMVDGQTISGESAPFTVPANGVVNLPHIVFGQTTPIPTSLTMTAPTPTLTQAGGTVQLAVSARYADGTRKDVTAAGTGTQYTISNTAIATISGDGLVQAVTSGTVLIQATQEGASGLTSIQVALAGVDTDGDGIPDDVELSLGMNPGNPVDASEDFDRDGLSNLDEYRQGTDLRNPDTDGDSLADGREVTLGTSPLLRDTDADGISDGLEVQTASDPLNPNSYNLSGALSGIAVTPPVFTLTFNTIAGDVSIQLKVTGTLRDGRTIDLTSTQRGTNYSSSDLTFCSFSAANGRVFAGQAGTCTITASVGGFSARERHRAYVRADTVVVHRSRRHGKWCRRQRQLRLCRGEWCGSQGRGRHEPHRSPHRRHSESAWERQRREGG
jgi:Big-like domain-containing protein/thrombospondin type 3 repeat protein